MDSLAWTSMMEPLLALAQQMEGVGQYSLAKLARAAADSLGRQAAYRHRTHRDGPALAAETRRLAEDLAALGLDGGLPEAMRRGAQALDEGRLPLLGDTPHPYVCRTCGQVAMGAPPEICPACGAWGETFQWFAPIYWLDALDPPAALRTLRRMPEELSALLDGLPAGAEGRVPQDGGWDMRSTVNHLRDAQGVLAYRIDLFLKEEHPLLESKAIFEWADRAEARPPTLMEIFNDYKAGREALLDRLEKLPILDWWRTGFHEEFGTISIKQQVSYFAAHELTHLPQIAALRREGGAV